MVYGSPSKLRFPYILKIHLSKFIKEKMRAIGDALQIIGMIHLSQYNNLGIRAFAPH